MSDVHNDAARAHRHTFSLEEKDQYAIKCALLGEAGVGKSALVQRFTRDSFTEHLPPTIGIDFGLQTVEMDEHTHVRLQLWDTAGQEKYHSLVQAYYRTCHVFFLVIDLTQWQSFTSAALWLRELRENRVVLSGDETARDGDDDACVVVLLGNVADRARDRAVPTATAHQWAEENGCMAYHEVSAKTGDGVVAAFEATTHHVVHDLERRFALAAPPKSIRCGCSREEECAAAVAPSGQVTCGVRFIPRRGRRHSGGGEPSRRALRLRVDDDDGDAEGMTSSLLGRCCR